MNSRPYSPLGRSAIQTLLRMAAEQGGHGFDVLTAADPTNSRKGPYEGFKGGLLTSQSGLWYDSDGFCYIVLWNGQHTKGNLTLESSDDGEWYPKFRAVLDAAANRTWPATDLFPSFGMPSFPATQGGWRWCSKCQCLFLQDNRARSVCPKEGRHTRRHSDNYILMRNSQLGYGQNNWRWCRKCQGLFFAGDSLGVCPAGDRHDPSESDDYSLVLNSPYNDLQQDWCRCRKCQGLFFAGDSMGVCPAGSGHDKSGSDNYSLAQN